MEGLGLVEGSGAAMLGDGSIEVSILENCLEDLSFIVQECRDNISVAKGQSQLIADLSMCIASIKNQI